MSDPTPKCPDCSYNSANAGGTTREYCTRSGRPLKFTYGGDQGEWTTQAMDSVQKDGRECGYAAKEG